MLVSLLSDLTVLDLDDEINGDWRFVDEARAVVKTGEFSDVIWHTVF